jgi:hypothetical protein
MVKRRSLFTLGVTFAAVVGFLAAGRAGADGGWGAASSSLEARTSCGATWQSVPSPSLWPSGSAFNSIAVAGPNDVWLVGSVESAHNRNALTEHWDGTEWRRVQAPALYPATELSAVLALGPNDVWAAGRWVTQDSVGVGLAKIVTLILHWDGTAWSVVPSPNSPAGTSSSMLTGLAASGPSDIWAIGQVDDWTTGIHAPLILHWDGARWSNIPTGDLGPGVKLYGVATARPGDAWVVGDGANGGGSTPLIAHWDGNTWTRRAGTGDHGYLRGVVAVAPDDAWAVGAPGLIRHWDGHAWSAPPAATSVAFGNELFAVAAATGTHDDIWAVGGGFNGNPLLPLATLHWDGAHWEALPNVTQVVTGDRADRFVSVAAAGRNNFWAVGDSMIAHYADPCAAGSPPNWPYTPMNDPQDTAVSYFPPVQHTLRGVFRAYWRSHGGLAQFGYPLTEQFSEKNPTDGKVYVVQYFERNRFEAHPEYAGTPSEVLLGLLGRTVTAERAAEAPFRPVPALQGSGQGVGLWFPESRHNLAPEFSTYWQAHGGLPAYGYPISEAFTETSRAGGGSYLVQYFERNRLEYHPELSDPFRVSLGLLGVQVLQPRGWIR